MGASLNGVADRRVYREEGQLSTDYHVTEGRTTTDTCGNHRTRSIDSSDTSSPAASSIVVLNVETSVPTKCDSCYLLTESDFYKWEIVDLKVLQIALKFRKELVKLNDNKKQLGKIISTINKGYVALRLSKLTPEVYKEISALFKQAMDECNPIYILKAYTEHQSFTQLLNKDMARIILHDIKQACTKFSCDTLYTTQDGTKAIARIFSHYSEFKEYTGMVYRGAVLDNELEHMQVNEHIMINTFLSTSKNAAVTDMFSDYDSEEKKPCPGDKKGKISFLFIFTIENINGRRTLEIGALSKYPQEEEILLLPYSVFLITRRETIEFPNQKSKRIEIHFEEYNEV